VLPLFEFSRWIQQINIVLKNLKKIKIRNQNRKRNQSELDDVEKNCYEKIEMRRWITIVSAGRLNPGKYRDLRRWLAGWKVLKNGLPLGSRLSKNFRDFDWYDSNWGSIKECRTRQNCFVTAVYVESVLALGLWRLISAC
jgi:hypothetical protein